MRYDSKRTVILSGKQYVQTNEKKEKGNQHRDSKTIIASWAAQQSDQYRAYRSGGGCDIKEVYNEDDGHDNLSIIFNMHDRLLWKNDV